MMKTREGMTAATASGIERIRWRNDRRSRPTKWRAGRRRRIRLLLISVALISAAGPVVLWWLEPPRLEPRFEQVDDEPVGPLKDFEFKDIRGALHTLADWTDRPGIVLIFLSTKCPVSNSYAPEVARLAGEFARSGVAFYGIHCDPDVTIESAIAHAAVHDLRFPILLDPTQRIARQVGAHLTPEAVLLASDGQVIYRGRIDDRYSPDGLRRPKARSRDLENALKAVVANELPAISKTRPFGSPLRSPGRGHGKDEAITFTKHVAPILWTNCARCHRPGAVAPFSLLTYQDAARRADFIRDVVMNGQMPPWKPHSGAGIFRDAPRLSPVEKEILEIWAQNGRPQGDPADLPPQPRFNDGWELGEPDVVITMPEAFTVPAAGRDVYRAFAVPVDIGRDLVINGLEFRPGNRRVVHHSRLYLDTTGDARRRDLADPAPGYFGHSLIAGTAELPYPGLGGWTPGMTARFAPDGVGRIVRNGSDLVIRIHYHTSGKPEEDRSSVGLFAAKKPTTRNMVGYTICSNKIDIPPGEKRHKIIVSAWVKADVHLYTVVPHAHYLCREFRVAATLPDGTSQPLLWIDDWDPDWQDQYRFLKPVRLPKGTLLTLAAYFDNSDGNPRNPHQPPRRVQFGLGSDDEMCACHFEFLPDEPSGYAAYPQKSPFGL
jgi:peroxiredoxin